ncbi:hypothetical protein OsJ_13369 [Oryza sativa Japonica Group]|uniref:Uncharacterized protein n=1 Tax=Oryza sativa subsp. japonica TaxID=39947 RepID=B9F7L5_ORYSJ|nr:hypothetical protein OsJ_13369 [Oryza sativa Japonica Group]
MVVGPLVSMVKEKASSYLMEQYKVMEGMEEQHKILKRKLPAILDVIADAEEQAAKHREGAKAWLEELRKVAYQANDVFDEFKYEALRRKAKANWQYKMLGMDVIKLFPTHNRIVFRYRMGNKLRMILNAIEVLITEMNAFRFKFRPEPPMSSMKWRKTDSKISEHSMDIANRSREEDRQKIVKSLLSQASNGDLTVIPIVGMGGMGKTTLAQLIYNDPQIQKHFQLLLWVCVSDNFDVDSLAKSIVEAARKQKNCNERAEFKEVVNGQRFLLVLDDVWNREASKWEALKSYVQHGGSGSSVLTTTRDKTVAEIMAPPKEVHHLKDLNENFIKEIIERSAFNSEEEKRQSELLEMDVKGIPFEFHDIKDSKITAKIHDLMHDVAQSSMGKECAAIDSESIGSEDFPYSARHLFLSGDRPEVILNSSLEKGYPGIQTLIYSSQNEDLQNLSKYRSLRALEIWGGIILKPKYHHHLRYLDLSCSEIKALPEDISILYHLQTLNLSHCSNLHRLPKGTKYMTALRHLYTHGCERLKSMPPNLGHLTCLQTLTCFVAGACSGCSDLGELRQSDLGGRLELTQLENVTKADAKAANLGKKKKLTELSLGWADQEYKEAQR